MAFYGVCTKTTTTKTTTAGLSATMLSSFFTPWLALASFYFGNTPVSGPDCPLVWVFSLTACPILLYTIFLFTNVLSYLETPIIGMLNALYAHTKCYTSIQ